ncbi:aa3-type cytochrome oxidase subunit CtaJ [Pseudonocardia sp. HH130630-07]|uniref:aa3-type cytochrome oxidase subunit CtaJ n=1 Tax=Pseudonocardia sp. HH130630-07 TaxID=1690815 RepID=UPI000814DED6|nr:hypothetical protein [Pseudonocardia sp. HH130630-07]ANY05599.1 hypothetical protein AFB00_03935 [Pseudonocardia sp. HH130630-07]
MTVVETLLVFVVAPVGLYAVVWAWIAVRNRSGRSRYTAGDPWPYEPLFWIANPAGAAHHAAHAPVDGSDVRGGTGGKW